MSVMAASEDPRLGWSTRIKYYPDKGRVLRTETDPLCVYSPIVRDLVPGKETWVVRFFVQSPARADETSAAFQLCAPGMHGRTFSIPFEDQPEGTMSSRKYYAVMVTDKLTQMDHACKRGDDLEMLMQDGTFKPAATWTLECCFVHQGPRATLGAAFEQHVHTIVTPALQKLAASGGRR